MIVYESRALEAKVNQHKWLQKKRAFNNGSHTGAESRFDHWAVYLNSEWTTYLCCLMSNRQIQTTVKNVSKESPLSFVNGS